MAKRTKAEKEETVSQRETKEFRCSCGHLLFKVNGNQLEIKHRGCPKVTTYDLKTLKMTGEREVVRLRG